MNGPPVTPSFRPVKAAVTTGGGTHKLSEAELNSMRIVAVAERLAMYSHPSGQKNPDQFIRLCLALARGIDYGVAKNEVPVHASMLPPFLKQVTCRTNELTVRAAIMVLMISVKNACKMGWFTAKDTEELLNLANEVGRCFGAISELTNETVDFMPIVSSVMSRFYPQLKLGHVIASLEVKPGYGTYVVDFHISKNMTLGQEDNIRLFVAMRDDIDTSSCIINPQQVNFLLNGKGVKCRTNVFMDQGPQLPTVVNSLLKYGTNLLQAVGQSNGHYVILIAFMSIISPAGLPMPQDYVQHDTASSSSDSEIIEGPSRICLHCPISFQRIRTPVKGYLCKHYQCFDLSNYFEVNFKQRPSWRCPHCSQSVCFTDLRVDQNMVKILREVGENVSEVIISADGSWTAASSNNCKDKLHHKISSKPQEGNDPPDPAVNGRPSDNFSNVCDLTEEDNGMHTAERCEPPDLKPMVDPNVQGLSISTNSTLPPITGSTNEFNRYSSTQVGTSLSSGTSMYESGDAGYTMRYEAQLGGVSQALTSNLGVSPLTNNFQGTNSPMSTMALGQFSASRGLQLHEGLHGQSIVSNDFGRAPLLLRNIQRIPSTIQTLPVQMPTPSPQQHSRPTASVPSPNVSALSPQVPFVSRPLSSSFERQGQFQQSSVCPINMSHITSASIQNRLAPQVMGHSTPGHNGRVPSTLRQPPHLSRSSQVPRSDNQQPRVSPGAMIGNASNNVQRVQLVPQIPSQIRQAEQQTLPLQIMLPMRPNSSFAGGMPQAVSRTENLINLQAEHNWRPAGRMRGALTGEAYSTALNELIAQATQPVQVPSPSPRPTISASSPRDILLANRMNAHAQPHNQPFMSNNATTIIKNARTQPEGHWGANQR